MNHLDPPLSRALAWTAFSAGVIHAAFSGYWALGGTWLLATVGQWALTLRAESPSGAGTVLLLVALVKATAAIVPVLVSYGRAPWRRFWRAVSWVGGTLLLAYGGVNIMLGTAVLAGAIRPEGGYDARAMIGHVFLWDPLFAAWGAALIASLWLSRAGSASAHHEHGLR